MSREVKCRLAPPIGGRVELVRCGKPFEDCGCAAEGWRDLGKRGTVFRAVRLDGRPWGLVAMDTQRMGVFNVEHLVWLREIPE